MRVNQLVSGSPSPRLSHPSGCCISAEKSCLAEPAKIIELWEKQIILLLKITMFGNNRYVTGIQGFSEIWNLLADSSKMEKKKKREKFTFKLKFL